MLTTRCLCSPLLSIASAHQWQVLSAERMPNPHPHPRPHPHQVLSAELMPNRYRSLGMALGNAVGWGLALLSMFFFPVRTRTLIRTRTRT